MLQSRLILTGAAIAASLLVTTACGGGGPIEDNVVRPGITAMDQASTLACGTNADTLRTAIEAYTSLEGAPPADESALVEAGYLREETSSWDIVDGELVAQDPACGGAPAGGTSTDTQPPVMTAPATTLGAIVTDTEPPQTPEQVLADLTDDEIAQVGGIECATELAEIFSAAERYQAELGTGPETLDELTDAGLLADPIELWVVVDDMLRPAPGSTCIALDAVEQAEICASEAQTLQVASEAYIAQFGATAQPTETELVEGGFMMAESDRLDLVDGEVVAVAGGPCEGVELPTSSG